MLKSIRGDLAEGMRKFGPEEPLSAIEIRALLLVLGLGAVLMGVLVAVFLLTYDFWGPGR